MNAFIVETPGCRTDMRLAHDKHAAGACLAILVLDRDGEVHPGFGPGWGGVRFDFQSGGIPLWSGPVLDPFSGSKLKAHTGQERPEIKNRESFPFFRVKLKAFVARKGPNKKIAVVLCSK